MRSGRYILGPEVEAFEAEFAAAMGTKHCVGVANGTDAITIGLRALEVGRDDEVIVPLDHLLRHARGGRQRRRAGRSSATSTPRHDCMTAEMVEPLITPARGRSSPSTSSATRRRWQSCRRLPPTAGSASSGTPPRLPARRSTAGPPPRSAIASTFSFYPSKNLGGFGDGGAIVTDTDELADSLRRIRFHGTLAKGFHERIGFNSRLDELQAAGLRVLLPHLPEWNRRRRAGIDAYRAAGLGDHVEMPVETDGAESAYHLFVVRSDDRDALSAALKERDVASRAYYTTPMHRQPSLTEYAPESPLVNSDRFAERNLALPVGPGLSESDVAQVVEAVASARAAALS